MEEKQLTVASVTHCPWCGSPVSVADEPYCANADCRWNNGRTLPERLSLTVADVLRIVDANPTRQEIERALIANLPSNAGQPVAWRQRVCDGLAWSDWRTDKSALEHWLTMGFEVQYAFPSDNTAKVDNTAAIRKGGQ